MRSSTITNILVIPFLILIISLLFFVDVDFKVGNFDTETADQFAFVGGSLLLIIIIYWGKIIEKKNLSSLREVGKILGLKLSLDKKFLEGTSGSLDGIYRNRRIHTEFFDKGKYIGHNPTEQGEFIQVQYNPISNLYIQIINNPKLKLKKKKPSFYEIFEVKIAEGRDLKNSELINASNEEKVKKYLTKEIKEILIRNQKDISYIEFTPKDIIITEGFQFTDAKKIIFFIDMLCNFADFIEKNLGVSKVITRKQLRIESKEPYSQKHLIPEIYDSFDEEPDNDNEDPDDSQKDLKSTIKFLFIGLFVFGFLLSLIYVPIILFETFDSSLHTDNSILSKFYFFIYRYFEIYFAMVLVGLILGFIVFLTIGVGYFFINIVGLDDDNFIVVNVSNPFFMAVIFFIILEFFIPNEGSIYLAFFFF